MTTVAWDGKTIAADGQRTHGGDCVVPGDVHNKLHVLKSGSVFAGAGDVGEILMVADWLDAGCKPGDRPKLSNDGFGGLIAHPRGRCEKIDSNLRPMPVNSRFMAVGSGESFALTAMYLGKTAEEAVRVASKFDVFTNGNVTSMTPRKKPVLH